MKTVSIVGNRPQLVKIIPELADVLIYTGQHYDASLKDAYTDQLEKCGEVVDLGEMEIEVKTFSDMIGLLGIQLIGTGNPLVTVYGDTDTTLAGAIAAKMAGCDIAHVEAELRCGNIGLPEEKNRIVVDALSTFRFSPQEYGDIMQERLWEIWHTHMGRQLPRKKNYNWICTIHRAENSEPDTMMGIIKNINTFVQHPRIYLHPKGEHLFREWEKIRLPAINSAITYHEMLRELWNCEGVITDSGGLLREAVWLGKPCIVLRNECEFPEFVEEGRIKLVGRSEEKLRDALEARDWNCRVELENPGTTDKILDHLGIERRFFGPKTVEVTQAEEKETEVACQR